MFSVSKWTVHYRAPNIEQIETLLEREGIPLAGPEATSQAVQAFRQKWAERNPTTPEPREAAKLLEKERQGKLGPHGRRGRAAPDHEPGGAGGVPQQRHLRLVRHSR